MYPSRTTKPLTCPATWPTSNPPLRHHGLAGWERGSCWASPRLCCACVVNHMLDLCMISAMWLSHECIQSWQPNMTLQVVEVPDSGRKLLQAGHDCNHHWEAAGGALLPSLSMELSAHAAVCWMQQPASLGVRAHLHPLLLITRTFTQAIACRNWILTVDIVSSGPA